MRGTLRARASGRTAEVRGRAIAALRGSRARALAHGHDVFERLTGPRNLPSIDQMIEMSPRNRQRRPGRSGTDRLFGIGRPRGPLPLRPWTPPLGGRVWPVRKGHVKEVRRYGGALLHHGAAGGAVENEPLATARRSPAQDPERVADICQTSASAPSAFLSPKRSNCPVAATWPRCCSFLDDRRVTRPAVGRITRPMSTACRESTR